MRRYLIVAAFSIAVFYGSTYQQFRFFTPADPGGASDAVEYVLMARGDPGVDIRGPHHYRWVIPAAVRVMLPLVKRVVHDDDLAIRLAFYLLNFSLATTTCLILFALLRALRYSTLLSLLGVCAFAWHSPRKP